MQTLFIFTIFDSKANAYLQPFFSVNSDTARREFHKAINQDGQFNAYAEDYSLFLLGSFDQDEGFLDIEDSPQHVVNGITLRELIYENDLEPPSIAELSAKAKAQSNV